MLSREQFIQNFSIIGVEKEFKEAFELLQIVAKAFEDINASDRADISCKETFNNLWQVIKKSYNENLENNIKFAIGYLDFQLPRDQLKEIKNSKQYEGFFPKPEKTSSKFKNIKLKKIHKAEEDNDLSDSDNDWDDVEWFENLNPEEEKEDEQMKIKRQI